MERKGVVTMKGAKVTLEGAELKIGQKAPDFSVIDGSLKQTGLKDFSGKILLISVTPSLDTPVCDRQARKFNEEAAKLNPNIEVLNISMDLPFAAQRFCASAGIDKVKTLSDHRDASFGTAYGVLIKELRLLARAIFVIGADGIIRHVEIVPEITGSVDFDKALNTAKSLTAK
ncbi:thiol peroxidase [bacterium]|nr:MAG: thiol peroxidase [bacterium]